jgi:hypothetical protein
MAIRRGERRTRRRTAALARARSIATGNGVRYAYVAAPDGAALCAWPKSRATRNVSGDVCQCVSGRECERFRPPAAEAAGRW